MEHLGILLGILLIGTLQQCSALNCMECMDLPNPAVCGNVAICPSNYSCITRQYVTSSGITLYSSSCASAQKCQALARRRAANTAGDVQEESVFDLETCDECCSDKDYCNLEGCGTKMTAREHRGPYCFECNVENEVTACRTNRLCDSGQACFISKSNFPGMYKTGCMPIKNCNRTLDRTMDASVLVGRRDGSGLSIALPTCCQGDFCNDINKFTASSTTTVNGGWSSWGAWSACSQTCQQTRSRSCDNPAPRNGGTGCHGNGADSRACATTTGCPVDGDWSQWGDWSACSVTCGANGTMTRMRSCDNPPPKNSGATCQGTGQASKPCAAAVTSCAEAHCQAQNYTVVPVTGTSQQLCLKLSGTINTWYNANIGCRSTGNGHLVSVHSSHENDAIVDFLHGKTSHEDNCKAHSYTVVPVAGTSQKLCLNLWNSYKSWSQARQACQAVGGGDLVKIDSAAVNTAVAGYLHAHHGHGHHERLDPEGYVWIGLKGVGEHHSLHYTWTDNTAAQYNLVAGGGGGHHHGKLDVMCVLGYWGRSHEWWPNDCHAGYCYLCEIPM